MEAERYHDLPSASLRSGKSGRIQLQSGGLMSEDRRQTFHLRGESESALPLPFVPFRSSGDWLMTAHTGKGDLDSVH